MFELFEDFAKQNEEADRERGGQSSENYSVLENSSQYSSSGNSAAKVFVVSAGGSLFFGEKPFVPKIVKFCETIGRLHSEDHRFVIVCGGGRVARNYVAAMRSFGASNFEQDKMGIAVTRVNAHLFVSALGGAFGEVLVRAEDALQVLERGKIPVFGGLFPFFTTDAVAALVCEAVGGTFVNLTDVDGVYSLDPKKNDRAKLFESISYEKLISMVKLAGSKPGQNLVLDLAACLILRRSSIKGIVLNGENLENFEAMVRGENFRGTVINADQKQNGIEDQVDEVE